MSVLIIEKISYNVTILAGLQYVSTKHKDAYGVSSNLNAKLNAHMQLKLVLHEYTQEKNASNQFLIL